MPRDDVPIHMPRPSGRKQSRKQKVRAVLKRVSTLDDTRAKDVRVSHSGGIRPGFTASPFKTCQYLHGPAAERNFCGKPTVLSRHGLRTSWCAEHYDLCVIEIRMDGRIPT